LGYAELRILLVAVVVVIIVYALGRVRRGREAPPSSGPRDPTATIRQLARVRDVDGLRHFLTAKGSSEAVRGAAEQELTALSKGPDTAIAQRALVALAAGLGSLGSGLQKETVERLLAALQRQEPAVLAWLTSGPGLDSGGPLAASLATLRKDTSAPAAARVAASAALLGAGVLGARAGAFLAAYRRQLDVEEQEDDDMGGGTALFTDPLDEPCAVISPIAVDDEVLLTTSGKVLLRKKVADERISEASEGTPARVERRWEISAPPAARLAAILGSCVSGVDTVVSDEESVLQNTPSLPLPG
jgi:hypothetical protein